MRILWLSIGILVCLIGTTAFGQSLSPPATIEGAVSTQQGTVRLPGALVVVVTDEGEEVGRQLADSQGSFRFEHLSAGTYHLIASLDGFQTMTTAVTVLSGGTTHAAIDLPISVSERVDVRAQDSLRSDAADPAGGTEAIGLHEADRYGGSSGLREALRLTASVVQVPNGLSIKGGRPEDAVVQLGAASMVDPSTGRVDLTLPADAVESVAVLPNPYAVEFGGFSAGVIVIDTRRAGKQWHVQVNDLDPNLRTARHNPLAVTGVLDFAPRLDLGGPLIKDRLFVEESAQFRYLTSDVPSRPENELKTQRWFTTFTRVDLNASPRRSVVASGGAFSSRAEDATLATFVPPDASVTIDDGVRHASISDRMIWNSHIVSESTVRLQEYDTTVDPYGSSAMEIRPDTTLGNFFNRQHRTTNTVQAVEAVTMAIDGPAANHLVKLGVDLLHSAYDGSSASRTVLVEHSDGSLARRLDFSGPATEAVKSTDIAAYAQDRVRFGSRWLVDVGGRLDRDGVLGRMNMTPRVGSAVALDSSGNVVLRAGVGLFFERTPSIAAAFGSFGAETDTRYGDPGSTVIAVPVPVVRVTPAALQTERSVVWNLTLEHRLTPAWTWHAGVLERRGSHELIVAPETTGSGEQLELRSAGRSLYRDLDAGFQFSRAPVVDLAVDYTRSMSRADLNAFTSFFGSVMAPIIGANAYGPTSTDSPNRLFVRGRLLPTPNWLLAGTVEWRTGFPYSTVDDALDFVGARNALRFPAYARLVLGAERRVRVGRLNPWVGVRVTNPFSGFLPTEVQNHVSSPNFGTFYNSEYRTIKIIVRFER